MSDPRKIMICKKCGSKMTDIQAKRDGCQKCLMDEYMEKCKKEAEKQKS